MNMTGTVLATTFAIAMVGAAMAPAAEATPIHHTQAFQENGVGPFVRDEAFVVGPNGMNVSMTGITNAGWGVRNPTPYHAVSTGPAVTDQLFTLGFDFTKLPVTVYLFAFDSLSSMMPVDEAKVTFNPGVADIIDPIRNPGATYARLVPEPASLAVFGAGLLGLGLFFKRRKPVLVRAA